MQVIKFMSSLLKIDRNDSVLPLLNLGWSIILLLTTAYDYYIPSARGYIGVTLVHRLIFPYKMFVELTYFSSIEVETVNVIIMNIVEVKKTLHLPLILTLLSYLP